MGLSTGTAANVAGLMAQVAAIATAKGWNVRQNVPGKLFIDDAPSTSSSGNYCWVAFRWDTATPEYVGIYQSLGFSGTGVDPGNHLSDSGQGVISGTNATLATGRHVRLVDSAMPFWIFAGTGTAKYLHVFAQTAVGKCVQFGFGTLFKHGDAWTGGQYAFGSRFNALDEHGAAVALQSSLLLDALSDATTGGLDTLGGAPFRATVHVEGIPNQPGGSKWGVIGNFVTTAPGNDRGAIARVKVHGGYRGGTGRSFGRYSSSSQKGLADMYAIDIHALTNSDVDARRLGSLPDARGISMEFFELGNNFLYGSERWYTFPSYKKGPGNVAGSSYFQGIAHKVAVP